MSKSKVLVVEDDHLTKDVLVQIIEALGYEVDACDNGEKAIQKISSFQPDLILSDVLMPEFSGLQLLNYLQKKTSSTIPVVLISTLDAHSLADIAEDVGAAGVLSKPPRKEEMAELFEKAINDSVPLLTA